MGFGSDTPTTEETTEGDSFGKDANIDDETLNCMRGSVLVSKNDEGAAVVGTREPSLTDFKMIIVLGKGTFGKVFLSEFSFNKQLYAIKVIRKDVLIEYN